MNRTNIGWTTLTSNPLKYRRKSDGAVVWACVKTSPGCRSCYAETLALRWDRGRLFSARNMEELEPFLDEAELRKMFTARVVDGVTVSGSRCFVADMTDLWGEWVPDELLDRLFAVFALRSDVTWQVLTKRAERMRKYLDASYLPGGILVALDRMDTPEACEAMGNDWPLPNVWCGVSVEDQARADERIPHLLATPAAVRFLSLEPMLGPVDLRPKAPDAYSILGRFYGTGSFDPAGMSPAPDRVLNCFPRIDWVIVGGESGPGHRPCEVSWIADVARQCAGAGVPCFVKQASGPRPGMQGAIPDSLWSLKELPR